MSTVILNTNKLGLLHFYNVTDFKVRGGQIDIWIKNEHFQYHVKDITYYSLDGKVTKKEEVV